MELEDVLDVVDKHIGFHEDLIEQCKVKIKIAQLLNLDIEAYLHEVNDSACAIASLEMLKNELKGEKVY